VDTLARADGLAGGEIFVPGEALRPPADDRIYDADLVGCAVIDAAGAPVGTVKDVLALGESTLLVVERPSPGGELLVPLSRSICTEIDLAGRRIVVDPPAGLFELNEI
jgi:16S rRNA processing protein RimM